MRIAELVLKYVQALAWPCVTLVLVWFLRAHVRAAFDRMTRVETPVGAIEFAAAARDVLRQAESAADDAALAGPAQWPVPQPVPAPQHPQHGTDGRLPAPAGVPGPAGTGSHPAPGGAPSPQPGTAYGGSQQVPAPPPAGSTRSPGGSLARARRTRLREARDAVDAAPAGAVATAWDALHTLCTDRITTAGFPAPSSPVEFGARLTSLGASPHVVTVVDRLRRLNADALREPAAVTPSAARDFVDACRGAAREIDRLGRYRGW
ncbi:hypothetical protein QQY24_23320 [Streptomyces sp. TG1A-8]|uniref:hypothetical protein n=1 Tax=Streptomyces sp. TG1A-8 TaxID=3051385 RepID=UPI00265C7308|nr:hypothetical protein [Streptomyces sp. TG1A-8]MDO0928202.1 hypothetical protein [Streptomyces sp. TG1A-8]